MPCKFEYACFISYSHANQNLVLGFMAQFKAALAASLEPLIDLPVFFDQDRLQGGYLYNEALASALCQSACMVAVYSPVYERRPYCGREFEAMVRLETQRLALAGVAGVAGVGRGRGLIIPVVLRGFEDLPPRIKDERHAVDFSQFTLADKQISRNREFVAKVDLIAHQIYGHCKALAPVEDAACIDCNTFRLPDEMELTPWRPAAVPAPAWPPQFPNR